jgi:antitoxin component YwqK of YwqJK toxin-antitoxin module
MSNSSILAMKHLYLIILSWAFIFTSYALPFQQDTVLNQTDSKGLKQGYWKKYYTNGSLMYQGYFKDDKPVGEMKRYFESGNLKAILIFDEKEDYSSVSIFYENGTLASEGFYAGSVKDSIWSYYSYYDTQLKSRETYKKGMKHGFSWEYYPDGRCFEKTEWKNNQKNGIWEQYFEDGSLRLNGQYIHGKLTGNFIVYYSKGHPMVIGGYKDNKREGSWKYFNDNGSMNYEIRYADGHPLNEKELTRQQQEFFRIIERNIGMYREPSPADFFPQKGYDGNEY